MCNRAHVIFGLKIPDSLNLTLDTTTVCINCYAAENVMKISGVMGKTSRGGRKVHIFKTGDYGCSYFQFE